MTLERIDYDPFSEEEDDENLTRIDFDPFKETEEATQMPMAHEGDHKMDAPKPVGQIAKAKELGKQLKAEVVGSIGDFMRSRAGLEEARDVHDMMKTFQDEKEDPQVRLANDPLNIDPDSPMGNIELRKRYGNFLNEYKERTGMDAPKHIKDAYRIAIAQEHSKKLRDYYTDLSEQYPDTEGTDIYTNPVANLFEKALKGLTRSAPIMAATIVNPVLGLAVGAVQMHGQKFTDYRKQGILASDADAAARLYSLPAAALEVAGNIIGIKAFKTVFSTAATKMAIPAIIQKKGGAILQNMAAEGFEELAQGEWEVVADVMAEMPEANVEDSMTEIVKRLKSSEQWAKRWESFSVGAAGGLIPGGAAVVLKAPVQVVKGVKNIMEPSPEQLAMAKNPLINLKDFDPEAETAVVDDDDVITKVEEGTQLATDTSDQGRATAIRTQETQQERIAAVKEINTQRAEAVAAKEEARLEQEQKAAAQFEQDQKIARSQQRSQFVEKVSTTEGLFEESGRLDAKPINDARKALVTEEDSVKKLKSLEYDLKNDKDLREQPYEYKITADALAERVRDRIGALEQAEEGKKYADENRKFQELQIKEEQQAEEAEAKKTKVAAKKEGAPTLEPVSKKATGDLFTEFEEKEEVSTDVEKVKPVEKKKEPQRMMRFKGARARAREKQLALTKAEISKRDAERRIPPKAPKVQAPPKDLQAAIKFPDGTILKGTSHFDIINTADLTLEQNEAVALKKATSGFISQGDGFMSGEATTAKYGVTKSFDLPGIRKKRVPVKPLTDKTEAPKKLKAQIEARIKEKEKLNLGKVTVVEQVSDLPKIEQTAEVRSGAIQGFWSPTDNTTYVIAGAHTDFVEALDTLWHESGHNTFQNLAAAGKLSADFKQITDMIKARYPTEVKVFRDGGYETDALAAEEVLINLFEKKRGTPIKMRVRGFLRRLAKALGFNPNMTDVQLDSIVKTMQKSVRRAQIAKGDEVTFSDDIQRLKKAGANEDALNYAQAMLESMPESYQEHFEVLTSDEAGTASVRLEKMGELKQDAKTIVTLFKEGDVGHVLEEFGYFAARRLLKRGEAKQLYNEWLKTKPKEVKEPADWQRWFAKSFAEWNLGRNSAPTSNLTKAFNKLKDAIKAIYLRFKGYKTEQTAVQSMFEDIATGQRDIVSEKYFYSDKNIRDRYLFGVDPTGADLANQGFSKNNKTHFSYDPGNICPKTEAFAGWLYNQFEQGQVELKDLTEQSVWVNLMDQARKEAIDVPCSYCYVEQNRRNAVILHNEGAAKSRVDYEKVKTMITAIPYTDYLLKRNTKGKNKGEYVFTDEMVKEANQRGGLRMFSFSDYIKSAHRVQIELLLEQAKLRGLSIKAITKRPEFVEDFAHTGITINVSIDNEGTGMDHAIAYRLAKKYSNVHVRTVAKNPADFVKLGKDSKIGIITLFHGDKANTPPGYESMSYKSTAVKEIIAKEPNLRNRTCCLNEAKCFNGKMDTQCQANCGAGMGKLTIPNIVVGEKSKQAQRLKINPALWEQAAQNISSAETSINKDKMPTLFSKYDFGAGETVFDIGGGKFDNVTDHLRKSDVIHRVYDPFNRPAEHNDEVLNLTDYEGGADVVTAANVLNVVAEPEIRNRIIRQAADIIKPHGRAIFGIYEGDGSGLGKETIKGYQNNMKTADYVAEVQAIFPNAVKKGNFIEASPEVALTIPVKKAGTAIDEGTIVQPVASDEVDLGRTPPDLSVSAEERSQRFSRKDLRDRVTPDQWKLIQQIGIKPTPFRDKVRKFLETAMDHIGTGLADPLYKIGKLQKKAGEIVVGEDAYMDLNMLSNFESIFRSFLEDGRLIWKNNWVQYNREDSGKGGLLKVFETLGDDAELFLLRQQAKSAQEMLNKGRSQLFGNNEAGELIDDQEMIDTLLASTDEVYAANKETWDNSETRLKEYNQSVLDILESASIIDGETRSTWERENYMPFFRTMTDFMDGDIKMLHPGATGAKIKGIKRLKGSRKNVGDPMSNLLNAYSSGIHNALRNVARVKALKLLKKFDLAERTDRTHGKGIVQIKVRGKDQYWQVEDKLTFNAIMHLDDVTSGTFSRIVSHPKRWLTYAVTQNPAFKLANWFRDSITTATLEKEFIPIIDSVRGMYHAGMDTETMKELRSTGGAFSGAYHQRDILSQTEKGIAKLRKRAKKGKRSWGNPLKYLDLYNKLGEMSENAARVGLYAKKRKKGQTAQEAGYAAKDLLDFHRSGTWATTRMFVSMVPFLNARIQGLYKLGREGTNTSKGKKHLANFYLTSAAIGMASLLNHLWNEDDERYKALTDDEKWYYFHIYDVPGLGHVRIPSPFEIGTLAGKLPVELFKSLFNQRFAGDSSLYDFAKFAFMDMFAFNPIPQFLKPIWHQYANRDSFTGAPIVPRGQELVDADEQFGPRTSALAKGIGKAAELAGLPEIAQSPLRIEKFFADYFSYLSALTFAGVDIAFDAATAAPEDPFLYDTLGYISGLSRFVRGDRPARRSRYEEKFYDMLLEGEKAHRTLNLLKKEGRRPEARAYRVEKRDLLRQRKSMLNYRKRLKRFKTQENLILRSGKSRDQKNKEIDALLIKRKALLKKAIDKYLAAGG